MSSGTACSVLSILERLSIGSVRARAGLLPFGVGLLIVASARFAAAQTAPTVRIELSSLDLRRPVELIASAADVVHAATELGLSKTFETVSTSSDRRGRLFRLSKVYLVDLPAVALAHTLGHEFGHDVRRREGGNQNTGFTLDNWPWPVPFVDAHGTGAVSLVGGFFDRASIRSTSGGYEAGRVRDRRFEDAFSSSEDIDQFLASQLIYSRLEEPLAAVFYLRESRLRDQKLFLFSNFSGGDNIDDPTAYALSFTNVRYNRIRLADAEAAARSIRKSARWALVDLQLAGSFFRVANYLWTGNSSGAVPALTVKEVRFWPRATFALSSSGIARGGEMLAVRKRTSIKVHAEKTEQAVPIAGHTRSPWSWGLAFSTTAKSARLRLEGNFWNQETGGRGGSAEGRVENRVRVLPGHTSAALSVGYKSAGFLAGAPAAARWFASTGLIFKAK